jgi:hypothetical protein
VIAFPLLCAVADGAVQKRTRKAAQKSMPRGIAIESNGFGHKVKLAIEMHSIQPG